MKISSALIRALEQRCTENPSQNVLDKLFPEPFLKNKS